MVNRCPVCDHHIEWMLTRFGRRFPFDYPPIPIEDPGAAENGWVAGEWYVQKRKRAVLLPLADTSHTRRAAIRHVVLPHCCTPALKDQLAEMKARARAAR